jgi:Flp pilus assembly pilin Flp
LNFGSLSVFLAANNSAERTLGEARKETPIPNRNMLKKIKRIFYRPIREEEGAATTEYAVLLALIILFGIGAILGTGQIQKILWEDTAVEMQVIE